MFLFTHNPKLTFLLSLLYSKIFSLRLKAFSKPIQNVYSSRTHVRLGAWFWSAQADIFFSESLHSTLRSGRRKTIVSQTMCALAEHLSQSEIELPLRNTCYYSPLAEVGVSTQTEMKQTRIRNLPHPGLLKSFWSFESVYSTVTDFARFLGLSTSRPFATLT